MAAEIGHFPNTFYLDQSQNAHLNGAKFFDVNERDVAPLLANMGAATVVTATAGAVVTQTTGTVLITATAAAAISLAAPVAGTNDGNSLKFLSTGAFAHVVSAPSNGINGNKTNATFAAAIANGFEVTAFNGEWYLDRQTGITLS